MYKITENDFGKLADGRSTKLFSIQNSQGTTVKLTDYGARLVAWILPEGTDIVLGYEDAPSYEKDTCYMGATVGRNANRIAKGHFTLEGRDYDLFINNGPNHLHGGKIGFDRKIWQSKLLENGVKFSYVSPDMEEGYPGELKVEVVYTLTEDNELQIKYSAESDAVTVCNLTNHSYFNLAGHDKGDLQGQKIAIDADGFTWADETAIPNGDIVDVTGTPMDLRKSVEILASIDDDYRQLIFGKGYDHNWCINNYDGKLRHVATAEAPQKGRKLEVYSTMPGIQFYTGNYLDGALTGKKGARFGERSGFALETQYYPNAVNIPDFVQPVIKPGEKWESETVYKIIF